MIKSKTKTMLVLAVGLACVATVVTASPVTTGQLQRLVDDATRGQSKDVAQCMIAAIHYVWHGSKYEQIRWANTNSEAAHEKHYYHDGSQVVEVVIEAEGHVRDLEITDTYEPITVKCMEIDNRLYRLEVEPRQK